MHHSPIIPFFTLSLLVFACNSGKNLETSVPTVRDTTAGQKLIEPLSDEGLSDIKVVEMPIIGIAYNQKGGAVLQTETETYWIDGLFSWDDKYLEKKVSVTGDLVTRNDNPVFLDTGKIVSQGIPVSSEEELKANQSRIWIVNATYELIRP